MATKKSNMGRYLRKRLGFDESWYDRSTGYWNVKCSQCEAIVINGTPCHEQNCPNEREHGQDN